MTVDEDFTISGTQLVFSPFSEGSTRRSLTIRTISNSNSEEDKTIFLEASAGDWPFVTGRRNTTVTINDCPGLLALMYTCNDHTLYTCLFYYKCSSSH